MPFRDQSPELWLIGKDYSKNPTGNASWESALSDPVLRRRVRLTDQKRSLSTSPILQF